VSGAEKKPKRSVEREQKDLYGFLGKMSWEEIMKDLRDKKDRF